MSLLSEHFKITSELLAGINKEFEGKKNYAKVSMTMKKTMSSRCRMLHTLM